MTRFFPKWVLIFIFAGLVLQPIECIRFPFPRHPNPTKISFDASDPIFIQQRGAWWAGYGRDFSLPNYLGQAVNKSCPFNCTFSNHPEVMNWADAILFEGQPLISFEDTYRRAPLFFPEKTVNQHFINFGYEQYVYFPILGEPNYNRIIDINSTYDQSNGVPITLACDWGGGPGISQFSQPHPVKTRSLVYMASNCHGGGALGRTEYVKELMKHIRVDSYGGCLKNTELPSKMRRPIYEDHGTSQRWKVELFSEYRFALTFENNNITDYVTEKIWIAFKAGTVPIYMGAPNIDEWVPGNHSIIRTDQFESPKALADYLHYLASHPNEYEKYFEWKNHPLRKSFMEKWNRCTFYGAECRLCEHLHNLRNQNGGVRKITARKAVEIATTTSTFSIPRNDSFKLTTQYAFALWALPYTVTDRSRLIDRNTPDMTGFHLEMMFVPGTQKTVLRFCAANMCFLGRKPLIPGKWYHFAVSFDSTIINGVKIFINGNLDSVHNSFQLPTTDISQQTTIGATTGPTRKYHFLGQIDEVSIWTRPLILEEVQSLQFNQLVGDEIGLMAYYPFNDMTPQASVKDLSINGLDLQIEGTISLKDSPGKPLYVSPFQ